MDNNRSTSPAAAPPAGRAWRLFLTIVAGCLLAWLSRLLLGWAGAAGVWVGALLLAGAWLQAVRFLLQDSQWSRFWAVWAVVATAMPVVVGPGPAGRALALGLAAIFLIFRRYRSYALLGSSRRAGAFALGLLALVATLAGWGLGDDEAAARPHRTIVALGWYAAWSLRIFWVISLLRLFLGMRLHFMRLRPKLAVAALFIALVPLVLGVALTLLGGYGALGGSLATRGRDLMLDWARQAREGGAPAALAFDGGEAPWLPDMAAALDDTAAAPAWADARIDTAFYCVVGDDLWLARIRRLPGGAPEIDGARVDVAAMDRLSRLLNADAGLLMRQGMNFGGAEQTAEYRLDLQGRLHREAAPDSAATDSSAIAGGVTFWRRPLGFGGAVLPAARLAGGRLDETGLLFHLQVRLADLRDDFLSGDANEINLAVVVGLGVVAALFLLLEAAALLLGLRIATGITSAVGRLHQGTRRLAEGDLETRIDLPNEDELGDLARSFNEMTLAVRRGRDEAVARERLERELATARTIQERLLPHDAPDVPGFEITGVSVPSLQVGGDYFDFLDLGDDRMGVAVGDVSGKGIPAALLMSNLQASLHGQVIHPSSVAEVVTRVNDLLVQSTDTHMFATFYYGVLDRRQCTFTGVNAGHNPPLLCRADGTIEELGAGGLILGMLPDQTYVQQTLTLDPGDMLVFYTDGITEAMGPRPEAPGDEAPPEDAPDLFPSLEDDSEDVSMFGEERLLSVLRAHRGRSAPEVREALLQAVSDFTAGEPQSDDVTLVVIRRRPGEGAADGR